MDMILTTLYAHEKNLGGFTVRRAVPTIHKKMVGPFVFFDHMGPVDFQIGNGIDVRPHPHIGISTLTYLFSGEILHRDSLGIVQPVQAGAVNWMTAGQGIVHSERSSTESRKTTQHLHGIQSWIALPVHEEERLPSFHHFAAKEIPELSEQGQRVRVIAGSLPTTLTANGTNQLISPVPVFTELTYLHLDLEKNSRFEFYLPKQELAIYVATGVLELDGTMLNSGALAVLNTNMEISFKAMTPTTLIILGGTPLPEQRHIWWNFVSSRLERIEQAKEQWKNRSFQHVPGEHEFIPLPEL